MWKALKILRSESLIHGRPRGATYAGPDKSASHHISGASYAWQRLKMRIGAEITSGEFIRRVGLPLTKLSLHYGANNRTVLKAMNALVSDGLLVSEGRKYRTLGAAHVRSRTSLALIGFGKADTGILATDPRTESVIRSFEGECVSLDIAPRLIGFDQADPSALLELASQLKKMPELSGFIVNLWKPWSKTHWQRWLDVMGVLAERKQPVMLLDQDGELQFPNRVLHSDLAKVLRIPGERAGASVGRSLLNHSYKNIAYVLPSSKLSWTMKRYEGLRSYVKQYGPPGSNVELFKRDELIDTSDLTLAIMDLSKSQVEQLYKERYSKEQIEGLTVKFGQKRWRELRGKVPMVTATDTVRKMSGFAAGLASAEHDPWAYDQFLTILLHIASNVARPLYFEDIFSETLEKSSATVWVCPDDITAIAAITFLKSRGKKVPDDIAMFGFDNARESLEFELSTYDFNIQGMVRKAVGMILNDKLRKSAEAITEIDGYVVERRTTRR